MSPWPGIPAFVERDWRDDRIEALEARLRQSDARIAELSGRSPTDERRKRRNKHEAKSEER